MTHIEPWEEEFKLYEEWFELMEQTLILIGAPRTAMSTGKNIKNFIRETLASQEAAVEKRIRAELSESVASEKKNAGYLEGQDEPTFAEQAWAEAYQDKAEAFYAGWDRCIARIVKLVKINKDTL
jgi:hypothetical protein